MGQFDLANRVKINNPSSDNDLMYGPYIDRATALSTVVSGLRDKGRRVGILNNGAVEDWWWKSGVLDDDLIPYINGSGQSIISDTHANIKLLVDSNSLIPESTYILTDYQTKHLIPNSDPQEINTGNIEPLTLIAATTNTFYVEAKSSLFPTDIIHYRFDDDSCEDGTRDVENKKWIGGTSRPGYIQYRKSTTNNLSTHYDWRNYKVRRWKLDAVEWVSTSIYNQKDIVKSPIDLNLYVCKKVTTELDVNDPSQDTLNYQLYLDLTIQNDGGFLSPVNNTSSYNIGNINNANIIINNTTPNIDYKDYYTFSILTEPNNSSGVVLTNTNGGIIGEGFKEFEIGKFDFDYFNYNYSGGIDLESNVFYLVPNGNNEYFRRDNKFGSNITYNTIGNNFYSNTIGNDFYSNTIGNDFYSNTIGNYFNSNTIGNNFYSNTIGNAFNSNTIGNDFYSNTQIGDAIVSNIIGNYFSNNIIRGGFGNNNIGNDCTKNDLHWSHNLIILDNFTDNIFEKSIDNIDFTTATLVYNTPQYIRKLFKNSAGIPRLSYYNENDQLVITDITA